MYRYLPIGTVPFPDGVRAEVIVHDIIESRQPETIVAAAPRPREFADALAWCIAARASLLNPPGLTPLPPTGRGMSLEARDG